MNASASTQRETVDFRIDIPEILALKYSRGKEIDGIHGPRCMFGTVDDRVFFTSPEVADRIHALGVRPGEEFVITARRKRGQRGVDYEVRRHTAQTASASRTLESLRDGSWQPQDADAVFEKFTRPAASPRPAGERSFGEAMARFLPEFASENTPAKRPATAPTATPSPMTQALCLAIDACIEAAAYAASKNVILKFAEEDYRAIAATIYINRSR